MDNSEKDNSKYLIHESFNILFVFICIAIRGQIESCTETIGGSE